MTCDYDTCSRQARITEPSRQLVLPSQAPVKGLMRAQRGGATGRGDRGGAAEVGVVPRRSAAELLTVL